jgi:hypothetical protein
VVICPCLSASRVRAVAAGGYIVSGGDSKPGAVLLNGRLELHGVDAERLSRALDDALRQRGAFLRPHEYDDALAFLLSVTWELGERWEPGRGGVSFSTFAYRTLRLRVIDFWRREYGGPAGSGRAPVTSGSGRSFSDSTIPTEIRWSTLSPQGAATMRQVILPLSMGLSTLEIGKRIGISRSSVERLVGELRDELERDVLR